MTTSGDDPVPLGSDPVAGADGSVPLDGDPRTEDAESGSVTEPTPETHPGFNRTNRPIAFDRNGGLFIAVDASANLCTDQMIPQGGAPVAERWTP